VPALVLEEAPLLEEMGKRVPPVDDLGWRIAGQLLGGVPSECILIALKPP
jgi:hypothetical protein